MASETGKYLAASVPRFIRGQRLSYLPVHSVIGWRFLKADNGVNQVYDIIMLPEIPFMRMRSYLAVPDTAAPTLEMIKFAPPYVLTDTKEIIVPPGEADPEAYARAFFIAAFKLTPEFIWNP